MASKTMAAAKRQKNDEFFTRRQEIEAELFKYRDQLKGKTILMPCDDPEIFPKMKGIFEEQKASQFWVYFHKNFKLIGLKKIIATHYSPGKKSYMIEYEGQGDDQNIFDFKKTFLKGDGDFRSKECTDLLKKSDIVITNPPFSLFRDFLSWIFSENKLFLVIGNISAITYKEIFPLFSENKIWLGYTIPSKFLVLKETGELELSTKFMGFTRWLTNLDVAKRHEIYETNWKYEGNEKKYQKYDNFDAININKSTEIPLDYEGLMGVPITFLDKYNPNQFKIVNLSRYIKGEVERNKRDLAIEGRDVYMRIIIKKN